jgi:hypothetical protein
MDLNKIFSTAGGSASGGQSKIFLGIICGIGAFIILLLVFKAGTMVGVRKADFSCRWSDNYHQNFGGPREGFMKGFGDRDFIDANGTTGQIIKIDGSTLVIKGRNDVEKVILLKEDTTISGPTDKLKSTDLKIDEYVVVIGEPNAQGQIEAKLIRLLPPMPPINGRGI